MLETLSKIITGLVEFTKGTKKNSEDIKKLNQQVTELSNMVLKLALKLENSEKMSEIERKLLLAELENILLRNGLQVPTRGISLPQLPHEEHEQDT